MKSRIETIRCLASREQQERYIVNGTASEYLLAEELVNDALEFVKHVECGNIGSRFTAWQRDQLAKLRVALEAADTNLHNDELVYRNQAWAAVRAAAQQFLHSYDETADRPAE